MLQQTLIGIYDYSQLQRNRYIAYHLVIFAYAAVFDLSREHKARHTWSTWEALLLSAKTAPAHYDTLCGSVTIFPLCSASLWTTLLYHSVSVSKKIVWKDCTLVSWSVHQLEHFYLPVSKEPVTRARNSGLHVSLTTCVTDHLEA